MARVSWGVAGLAWAGMLVAEGAMAQNIVPPPPGAKPDVGCQVQGLNYDSDGYLKLRAGPGTEFDVLDVFRNGDAAFLGAPCQGRWCYVENGVKDGKKATFRGWIYDGWCMFYP